MPERVPDPVADEPDGEEPQSGLGRGLAAIIPTLAPDLDPPKEKRRRRGGVASFLTPPPTPSPTTDEVDAPPAVTEDQQPAPETEQPTEQDGDVGAFRQRPLDAEEGAGGPVPPPQAASEQEGEQAVHPPAPSAVRELRDDLVGALLDGLARTMSLDVCGYLHRGPGEQPHLFLQAPSLDDIGPARAYELFDALRADLDGGRSHPDFVAAGFQGVTVATSGVGSQGVWVVGRVDDVSRPEREVATRFCRSFGRAVHQLDGAGAPAMTIATPVHVQAHRARDSVLAEVQVRIGDQIRPGHGRADTGVEAVTRAVIVAAGRHVEFRYASEVAHEGEHAAVVLVEGRDHAVALGSALTREAGGVATALAAIRALDGLPG